MKYSSIQFPVFKPYVKPAIEIYLSGCTNYCEECCNSDLQDFSLGKDVDKEFYMYLVDREHLFNCVGVLGGDLLCQPDIIEQICFSSMLRSLFDEKELWLFTGKEKEECQPWIFDVYDVVKVGKYDKTKKINGFPASSNQKVLRKGVDF